MPRCAGGRLRDVPPADRDRAAGRRVQPGDERSVVDLPHPEGPSRTTTTRRRIEGDAVEGARVRIVLGDVRSWMADTGAFSPKMAPAHRTPRRKPAMLLWFVIIYWIVSVAIGIYARQVGAQLAATSRSPAGGCRCTS
jgi:hypothetical protein